LPENLLQANTLQWFILSPISMGACEMSLKTMIIDVVFLAPLLPDHGVCIKADSRNRFAVSRRMVKGVRAALLKPFL
jgi:hypothetical protein